MSGCSKYGNSRFVSCCFLGISRILMLEERRLPGLDQKKTGQFLKRLRNEKGLTQEQLAEKFNVSNRTVSRWETGSNMPDISLLVEIADFYDVDVREIIEGERKSEMMDKETREVAVKMADYANSEKGRLFKTIRIISILGELILAAAIVFKCINFRAGIPDFVTVVLLFLAFAAMTALTLYVNGILQKIRKNRLITAGLFVLLSVVSYAFIKTVLMFLTMAGVIAVELLVPVKKGNEVYDKAQIVKDFGSEMNSGFFVFPDDLDNTVQNEFSYSTKTGMFDTDGYFILKAVYSDEDFRAEEERISEISCEIKNKYSSHTNYIKYDDVSYNYPAYVAIDGYDHAYEYALLDEENDTIIYVSLSYPQSTDLRGYEDYLKKDPDAYDLGNKSTLENFTIYYFRFPGYDAWIKYD